MQMMRRSSGAPCSEFRAVGPQAAHPHGGQVGEGRVAVAVEEVDVGGRQGVGRHDPRVPDLAGGQAHQQRVSVPPPARRQQPAGTVWRHPCKVCVCRHQRHRCARKMGAVCASLSAMLVCCRLANVACSHLRAGTQGLTFQVAHLRSSGGASGLLPQRISSATPRISTYSARLVCRVFGLQDSPGPPRQPLTQRTCCHTVS